MFTMEDSEKGTSSHGVPRISQSIFFLECSGISMKLVGVAESRCTYPHCF